MVPGHLWFVPKGSLLQLNVILLLVDVPGVSLLLADKRLYLNRQANEGWRLMADSGLYKWAVASADRRKRVKRFKILNRKFSFWKSFESILRENIVTKRTFFLIDLKSDIFLSFPVTFYNLQSR